MTVMPDNTTARPDVVVKITTDPTEAAFVSLLLSKKLEQEGLVRYFAVKKLGGERRGHEIFAIWRESAQHVGQVVGHRAFDGRYRPRFSHLLNRFRTWADDVRKTLKKADDPWLLLEQAKQPLMQEWAVDRVLYGYDEINVLIAVWPIRDAARRVAALLRACEMVAQQLAGERESYLIGQALENLLDEGILLADVHGGNVGMIDRHKSPSKCQRSDGTISEGAIVITDPGHAIFLRRDLGEAADAISAGGAGSSRPRQGNPADVIRLDVVKKERAKKDRRVKEELTDATMAELLSLGFPHAGPNPSDPLLDDPEVLEKNFDRRFALASQRGSKVDGRPARDDRSEAEPGEGRLARGAPGEARRGRPQGGARPAAPAGVHGALEGPGKGRIRPLPAGCPLDPRKPCPGRRSRPPARVLVTSRAPGKGLIHMA